MGAQDKLALTLTLSLVMVWGVEFAGKNANDRICTEGDQTVKTATRVHCFTDVSLDNILQKMYKAVVLLSFIYLIFKARYA